MYPNHIVELHNCPYCEKHPNVDLECGDIESCCNQMKSGLEINKESFGDHHDLAWNSAVVNHIGYIVWNMGFKTVRQINDSLK